MPDAWFLRPVFSKAAGIEGHPTTTWHFVAPSMGLRNPRAWHYLRGVRTFDLVSSQLASCSGSGWVPGEGTQPIDSHPGTCLIPALWERHPQLPSASGVAHTAYRSNESCFNICHLFL